MSTCLCERIEELRQNLVMRRLGIGKPLKFNEKRLLAAINRVIEHFMVKPIPESSEVKAAMRKAKRILNKYEPKSSIKK